MKKKILMAIISAVFVISGATFFAVKEANNSNHSVNDSNQITLTVKRTISNYVLQEDFVTWKFGYVNSNGTTSCDSTIKGKLADSITGEKNINGLAFKNITTTKDSYIIFESDFFFGDSIVGDNVKNLYAKSTYNNGKKVGENSNFLIPDISGVNDINKRNNFYGYGQEDTGLYYMYFLADPCIQTNCPAQDKDPIQSGDKYLDFKGIDKNSDKQYYINELDYVTV